MVGDADPVPVVAFCAVCRPVAWQFAVPDAPLKAALPRLGVAKPIANRFRLGSTGGQAFMIEEERKP